MWKRRYTALRGIVKRPLRKIHTITILTIPFASMPALAFADVSLDTKGFRK
jgi:hypothetical protein